MNKALKSALVLIVIVGIILGIFYIINENDTIAYITEDEFSTVVDKDSYVMVYFGEETEEINDMLKSFESEYLIKSYYLPFDLEKLQKFLPSEQYENNEVFVLYIDGRYEGVIKSTEEERVRELIRKYIYGEIPEDERYYQVLSTANEYIKKFNSKDLTVAVFGEASCTYCTLYLPVINEIAQEYNLDIYYFDADAYDEYEYEEIMELDLVIPAECTNNGLATSFLSGFPKPMTIITKNGKLEACIKGYYNKDHIVSKFKELKVIKED